MICNFCGAFLRDGAEKCSTCGRPTAPADTADDKPFLLGRESTDYADVPPAPEPSVPPEPPVPPAPNVPLSLCLTPKIFALRATTLNLPPKASRKALRAL